MMKVGGKMKVLKKIKKIVMGLLVAMFFVIAIVLSLCIINRNKYGVTQFDNNSLVIIKGDIATENYQKGDLVVVEGQQLNQIKVGDEIFIYQVDDTGVVAIDLGIIGQVQADANTITFKNGSTYDHEFVIGKAKHVYEGMGTFLGFILSSMGFLFIIVLPCFLIFIYQIYSLVVEIKYGNQAETK